MNLQHDQSTAKVYFALWPTEAERAALVVWQQAMRQLCGGRAMRGATLHSTLVFLGEVAQSRLEALQLAAQEVRAESFELCLDEAHYWGHNHIVYAAPAVLPRQLEQLVVVLEQRLVAHRFKFEQRPYRSHVTLLRNARWTDEPLPEMQPVNWKVEDFALVQSLPQDGPASYRVLARFPLLASGTPSDG